MAAAADTGWSDQMVVPALTRLWTQPGDEEAAGVMTEPGRPERHGRLQLQQAVEQPQEAEGDPEEPAGRGLGVGPRLGHLDVGRARGHRPSVVHGAGHVPGHRQEDARGRPGSGAGGRGWTGRRRRWWGCRTGVRAPFLACALHSPVGPISTAGVPCGPSGALGPGPTECRARSRPTYRGLPTHRAQPSPRHRYRDGRPTGVRTPGVETDGLHHSRCGSALARPTVPRLRLRPGRRPGSAGAPASS